MQKVSEIRLDCDDDVVLLKVEQIGRHRLPHRTSLLFLPEAGKDDQGGDHWVTTDPVIEEPRRDLP